MAATAAASGTASVQGVVVGKISEASDSWQLSVSVVVLPASSTAVTVLFSSMLLATENFFYLK